MFNASDVDLTYIYMYTHIHMIWLWYRGHVYGEMRAPYKGMPISYIYAISIYHTCMSCIHVQHTYAHIYMQCKLGLYVLSASLYIYRHIPLKRWSLNWQVAPAKPRPIFTSVLAHAPSMSPSIYLSIYRPLSSKKSSVDIGPPLHYLFIIIFFEALWCISR